ncbi:hypothetical protein [Sandaracinus amylolyticus]|uniref:Clumping factor A n=1 Tax=Sandaracinus amylolyticus TaxID=927083 RepID=A0A0F6YK12_9BACT|nr:hypothetical protein [Sandaracinus amylolyticus]AKF07795.1 Clumping factor A precursor [Sandaracinus amylolyticus]
MRKIGLVAMAALLGLASVAPGCSNEDGNGDDGDAGGSGIDAGGDGTDGGGGGGMDATVDGDGGTGLDGAIFGEAGFVEVDGGILLPDGAIVACVQAECQGRLYLCGNCLDDDGDGLSDSEDPDCLGPCDNSEDRLDPAIPGIGEQCTRDCYFDQDSGDGNDDCSYDLPCDPLSPGSRPANPTCPYDDRRTCETEQSAACLDFCGPLVPNGCDCFGCCDIGGTGDNWVFIGSVPETGQPACTVEEALDHNYGSCRRCTPNMDCFNDCGRCELCLGRDPATIPADCFPPPPPSDAGVPRDDAGNPIDAGPRDAGTPTDAGPPPPPRCEDDRQPCGLPTDPACPGGYYCLTGCCIYFG